MLGRKVAGWGVAGMGRGWKSKWAQEPKVGALSLGACGLLERLLNLVEKFLFFSLDSWYPIQASSRGCLGSETGNGEGRWGECHSPGLREDTAVPARPTLPATLGPGKYILCGQSCQPLRVTWTHAQLGTWVCITLAVLATQVKQIRFGYFKVRFGYLPNQDSVSGKRAGIGDRGQRGFVPPL